jgi:hypothetical protein
MIMYCSLFEKSCIIVSHISREDFTKKNIYAEREIEKKHKFIYFNFS